MRIYLGTYTRKISKGIYFIDLDESTGKLGEPQLAVAVGSPGYIAMHPNKKFFYSIGEGGEYKGKKTGTVHSFALQADGTLKALNVQSSGGGGPAFIATDLAGTSALIANYGQGSVSVLPIKSDGALDEPTDVVQHSGKGPVADRQAGPHAHSIVPDPAGKYALACDLGTDHVIVYRLGDNKLTEASRLAIAPGSGPRMTQFADDCTRVYLVNELNNTVCYLQFDSETGSLKHVQTLTTMPSDFKEFSKAAAIGIHPSQKFLYASNRGHDSLAMFTLDSAGRMTAAGWTPCGGKYPRHFAIDPSGKYLLCGHEESDSVTLFTIASDGKLTEMQTVTVGTPICVVFA